MHTNTNHKTLIFKIINNKFKNNIFKIINNKFNNNIFKIINRVYLNIFKYYRWKWIWQSKLFNEKFGLWSIIYFSISSWSD